MEPNERNLHCFGEGRYNLPNCICKDVFNQIDPSHGDADLRAHFDASHLEN